MTVTSWQSLRWFFRCINRCILPPLLILGLKIRRVPWVVWDPPMLTFNLLLHLYKGQHLSSFWSVKKLRFPQNQAIWEQSGHHTVLGPPHNDTLYLLLTMQNVLPLLSLPSIPKSVWIESWFAFSVPAPETEQTVQTSRASSCSPDSRKSLLWRMLEEKGKMVDFGYESCSPLQQAFCSKSWKWTEKVIYNPVTDH